MDDAERARQGMTVRREVLGDEHVDRAVAATTPFTEPFQDFITRYAWGDIWSRPGLSRAERSLVTLSVLAAMQHEHELAMHVKAALRNGLTPEQIGRSCSRWRCTPACRSPTGPSRSRSARWPKPGRRMTRPSRPSRNSFRPLTLLSGAPVPRTGKLSARHTPASDMRTTVLMAIAEALSLA